MAPLASRAAFKVHSQVTCMFASKSNVKEIHRSRRLKCFKVGFDFSSTEVSFFFHL